jgi:hypothetical protein
MTERLEVCLETKTALTRCTDKTDETRCEWVLTVLSVPQVAHVEKFRRPQGIGAQLRKPASLQR